jgi:ABC-type transport system substrate-binding protein
VAFRTSLPSTPYTVRITLEAYDPVFLLRMLGYQQGYIVRKKAVAQYGDAYAWYPVGTSPFCLTSRC